MRLRVDGRIWEFIDFVFEVNFANLQDFSNADQNIQIGSVGLTDVNITLREVPIFGNVKIGYFLPPISLEHITSSNYVYYMERSTRSSTASTMPTASICPTPSSSLRCEMENVSAEGLAHRPSGPDGIGP